MARTYSSTPLTLEEKEKINFLSAAGRTPNAIGKAINRSPHTIARHLRCPEAQEKVEVIKLELADVFEDLARRMVDSITDDDILELSAYQRTISSGIAVDKMRLLRDQSTEIHDVRVLTAELTAFLEATKPEKDDPDLIKKKRKGSL